MRKIILIVGVAAALVVLGLLGYGAYLVGSLDTPEFKETLLAHARAKVGAEVEVRELRISVLSGVTLEGVTIANPPPFQGRLLTADSFVLRYRLLPLLSGRLEVERLVLGRPRIQLAMDAKGAFNYEKLGSPAAAAAPSRPPADRAEAGDGGLASPIALELKQLAVEGADIEMRDHTEALLMKVEDASLDSSLALTSAGAGGSGQARIAALNLADMMFVRDVSSPIEISKQALRLSPIRGKLAGGEVAGNVRVQLAPSFGFTAELELGGASVDTLLQEARSTRAVAGTLAMHASFEGSGGLPTLKGKGRAEIADCKIKDAKVMLLLAAVLRLPELANPDFDECLVEFRMTGSRLRTPVLNLRGPQLQLSGSGTYDLDSLAIDYEMTLALARPLFAKVTARELRAAFKEREDGFSAVDFAVTGTASAPRTDLATKLGKAAAGEVAKKGLSRLLGKKGR